MIGIKVCRGSSYPGQCKETGDEALNWGNDISDVLLVNEDVALERGRVEIDSTYSNRVDASVMLATRIFVFPGSFVGINEGGEIKSGMLKSLKLSIKRSNDSFSTSTNMTIERNL